MLNGSGKVLAAEDTAEALATKGYNAQVGGNAESFDFTSSAVYYAPAYRDAAKKIQALLGPSATSAPLQASQARGNKVVVVAGADFTGKLATPPPAVTEPPASTVDTTSLVAGCAAHSARPRLEGDGADEGRERLEPFGSCAVPDERGHREAVAPSIKMVFEAGYHKYWGIEMTTMKNPPIVEGETGSYDSGGRKYLTYYDGQNLQRLAFRKGNVTFWISNTLENDLSAKTIEEIAKSMRPLNRAKLQKGRTDTSISVETRARRREPRARRSDRGRLRRPGHGRLPRVDGAPRDPARHRRAEGGRAQRRGRADLRARRRRADGRAPGAAGLHALARARCWSLGDRLRRGGHAAHLLRRRRPVAGDGAWWTSSSGWAPTRATCW